jgi:pentatricopeptide repeat protein
MSPFIGKQSIAYEVDLSLQYRRARNLQKALQILDLMQSSQVKFYKKLA